MVALWRGSPTAEGLTAHEIMTTDAVTRAPTETAAFVVRRRLRLACTLLVVDDRHLVGVLSRHDVLRLLDRPDHEIMAGVSELLADPLWAPDGHDVEVEVRDGVVILTGTVLHPIDKRLVRNLAGEVPGVIKVVDRLTWQIPEPKPGPVSADPEAPLARFLSGSV